MMKDFDQEGFLEMLHAKYADCMRSMFMELLAEIVDDAYTNYNESRNEIVLRLSDMLPGLEVGEAAQFVDDSCLTEWVKAEKRKWKEAHK